MLGLEGLRKIAKYPLYISCCLAFSLSPVLIFYEVDVGVALVSRPESRSALVELQRYAPLLGLAELGSVALDVAFVQIGLPVVRPLQLALLQLRCASAGLATAAERVLQQSAAVELRPLVASLLLLALRALRVEPLGFLAERGAFADWLAEPRDHLQPVAFRPELLLVRLRPLVRRLEQQGLPQLEGARRLHDNPMGRNRRTDNVHGHGHVHTHVHDVHGVQAHDHKEDDVERLAF